MSKIKAPRQGSKSTPKRAAYVPETATVDFGHEYPSLPISPPFVLVYNPQRWTVLGGKVLPQLHKMPLQVGVNGVTRAANGAYKLAKLKDKIETQGRSLIPHDLGPDGSYIDAVETRTPSGAVVETYVSCFSETFAGSSEIRPDTAAYVAWLEGLIASGDLPAPPPNIVEKMLRDRQDSLLHALKANLKSPSPSRDKIIAALEGEVEQLEALNKGAPKVPARKRAAAVNIE